MRIFKVIRDFLEGVWEAQKASLTDPLKRAKDANDDALMFIVFGDFLGYPFQSTFYSRYFFVRQYEQILTWRRRLLKERDTLDKFYD